MVIGPSCPPLRAPPLPRLWVSVIEPSPVLLPGYDCAAPHDARSSAASSRLSHAAKTPQSRCICGAMFGWKVAPGVVAVAAAALAVSASAWPCAAAPSLRDMIFGKEKSDDRRG